MTKPNKTDSALPPLRKKLWLTPKRQLKTFGPYHYLTAKAVILDADGSIVLQARPDAKAKAPGALRLGCFGGQVEAGESILAGIRREFKEELLHNPHPDDFVRIEDFERRKNGGRQLLFYMFYRNRGAMLEHCTDGDIRRFATVAAALAQPGLNLRLRATLGKARNRGLIPA